jgi:hypothetical protein
MILSLLLLLSSTPAFSSISPTCADGLRAEEIVPLSPSDQQEINRIAVETLRVSFNLELYRHLEDSGSWVPEYISKYFGYSQFRIPFPHIRETEGMEGLSISNEQLHAAWSWLERADFQVRILGERVFPKTLVDPVKFIQGQYDKGSIYVSRQIAVGIEARDTDGTVRHFAIRFAYKFENGKPTLDVSQQTGERPTVVETPKSATFADAYSTFGGSLIPERPVFRAAEGASGLPFDEIMVDLMLPESKGASFSLLKNGVALNGGNIGGTFRFDLLSQNGWKRRYGAITTNKYVYFSGYIFEVDLNKGTIEVQKRSQVLWAPFNQGKPVLFTREE